MTGGDALSVCGTVEAFCGGVWVDISDAVELSTGPCEARHGQQTAALLSADYTASLTLALRDDDRRFMPDNVDSDLYPDFDQGTPIRWTDVVNSTTVWHFNGYVETIDTVVVTDEADGEDAHQRAVISAIDLVTRIDRGRAFISTLGAHIASYNDRGTPTGVLDHFWPLTDSAPPYRARVGTYPLLASIQRASTTAGDTQAAVVPASGGSIYGDDGTAAYLQMGVAGGASSDSPTLSVGVGGIGGGFIPPANVAGFSGDAILMWVNPELPFDEAVTLLTGTISWQSTGNATWTLKRLASGSGGVFELALTGSMSATITTSVVMPTDRWCLVGVAIHVASVTTSVKLWIDDQVFTTTAAGAGTIPSFDGASLTIGGKLQGSVIYAQAYSIAPSNAEVLEQYRVGLYGLHRQTVTERINSLLAYAGVDLASTDVETTSKHMQAATLAGQRPGAEIRVAATTDQGVWFGAPDGTATFQSRRHRYYNPNVAPVSIPYGWLGTPMALRRDPPINSATITQAQGGAVGYDEDAASIAGPAGDQPFEATLESACSSSPAVLADFIVNQYVTPKTRLLQLIFDLDGMDSDAARLTVLSLGIGDRIEITDPPAAWPTSAVHMSIEGRQMTAANQNTLILLGAPVIGAPGGSDTWFRLGTSALGGTDVLPF